MVIEAPSYSDSTVFVSDVVSYLDQTIQLNCQHSLQKSGLVVGDMDMIVNGILICLDITEPVLEESIEKGCNLLITHQSPFLEPIDKITSEYCVGQHIIKAIKHGLAIYVCDTNLDHLGNGASYKMASKIDLQEMRPMVAQKVNLYKLVTFAPLHTEKYIIESLYRVGAVFAFAAHNLIEYADGVVESVCDAVDSYQLSQCHRGLQVEMRQENQLTFIVPIHCRQKIIETLLHVHPYKKVSYYLEKIETTAADKGSGVIGTLPVALPAKYFLKYTKTKLNLSHLQYTNCLERTIKTVAIYAGDGAAFLGEILNKKVDAFITTGLQHAHFRQANGKMLMVDIGHHSTRLGVKKLIHAILSKEFNNIAILSCTTITNPVHSLND